MLEFFFSIFRGIEIQGFVETSVSTEMLFWCFQALCSLHGYLLRNGMFEKINYLRFSSLYGIVQLPCMTLGWGFLSPCTDNTFHSPKGIKRGPQSKIGADDTRISFFATLLTKGCNCRTLFLYVVQTYIFLSLPSTSWMYSGTEMPSLELSRQTFHSLGIQLIRTSQMPSPHERHRTTQCCYC